MSGLEALGVACNIFQVISFTHESISLCKRVYRDGSPCPSLSENSALLGTFSNQIQNLAPPTKAKWSKDEQQLVDVASRCQKLATDLQEEINFIVGQVKQGSLATTLKIAAKTNWRKRRLDTLEKKLGDVQKLMETGLLVRICTKIDVYSLSVESLDKRLEYFIEQYKNGQRTLSGLVSRETLDTRAHITSELTRTEATIKQHVSDEARRSETAIYGHVSDVAKESSTRICTEIQGIRLDSRIVAQRDRLLDSLKFPGMNERYNQVSENYETTFRWVLEEGSEEEEEESNEEDIINGVSKARWDSFPAWLRSDGTVYWISGKPGSGKTTLLKYLKLHSETTNLLSFWNPGALVISHFFWRPGSAMQKNIKGFLCSILYQVIKAHEAAVNYVLRTYNGIGLKDSDTDWSIREARNVLMGVVQHMKTPIFFFIDGIDEIETQEGIYDLLGIMDDLKQVSHMKMCLSSRPEKFLQDRFHDYPQLHIHNLTVEDLCNYTFGSIRLPTVDSTDLNQWEKQQIVQSLVEKADGVFLWLVLAVNSINRGLSNGDGYDILSQRIDSLPGDLVALYQDMWARMNDDRGFYRKQAALYFNIIIACNNFFPKYAIADRPKSCLAPDISILEMAFAAAPPDDDFFSAKAAISAETLVKQCENVEKSVRVCCAGFIEIIESPATRGRYRESEFKDIEFNRLLPYTFGEKTIRFVHRTAFDFMVDTAEGQEILEYNTTPPLMLELNIIKANLAVRQVFLLGGLEDRTMWGQDIICGWVETTILDDLWHIIDKVEGNKKLESEAQLLIGLCERVYIMAQPYEAEWRQCSDYFLVQAAAYNLGDYVPHALTARHATDSFKGDILWHACGETLFFLTPSKMKLIRRLLALGCDPHARRISSLGPGDQGVDESAFSHFLKTIMCIFRRFDHKPHVKFSMLYTEEVRKTIDAFICHGASIDVTVCLAFEVLENKGNWVDMSYCSSMDVWDYGIMGPSSCLVEFPAGFLIEAVLNKLDILRTNEGNGLLDTEYESSVCNSVEDVGLAGSRVIALLDFSCRGGSHLKVTQQDSQYLAIALESWLREGRRNSAAYITAVDRWREVCERSERAINIGTTLAEFGYKLLRPL
ncbi:Fc.00g027260.m01.CDS01 [Cosmosporella sp. VM-42]